MNKVDYGEFMDAIRACYDWTSDNFPQEQYPLLEITKAEFQTQHHHQYLELTMLAFDQEDSPFTIVTKCLMKDSHTFKVSLVNADAEPKSRESSVWTSTT
jgi:hypothetical protein